MEDNTQFETDPLYYHIKDKRRKPSTPLDNLKDQFKQYQTNVLVGGQQGNLDIREYEDYFKGETFSETSDPDELRARRQSTVS